MTVLNIKVKEQLTKDIYAVILRSLPQKSVKEWCNELTSGGGDGADGPFDVQVIPN